MPFVSRELLRLALDRLGRDYSPLLLVSVPCMVSSKVPTVAETSKLERQAVPFGSNDERAWLEKYFRVPGGPPGKPYYMPGTRSWVQERYPDRALQRRRKDFEANVFFHPTQAKWAFRPDAAATLQQRVLESKPRIPLVALCVWMWRDREFASLESAVEEFAEEIGFDRVGLLGTVYEQGVPTEFIDAGLSQSPLDASVIGELIGATTPPPPPLELAVVLESLEETLAKRHYVSAPGLVRRVVGGWLVGDVVVLVGPPGTGKTLLAQLLAEGLARLFDDRFASSFLEIGPDYDVAQFLGYENLAGEFTAGRFAKEVLLTGEPTDPRLVVLDEWNLAQIDAYFAAVLSMIETGLPSKLPGRIQLASMGDDERVTLLRAQPGIEEGVWRLPTDTFILATCNSWADEPETRLPISGPVKRRCRIIAMPNVLLARFQEKGVTAIAEVCDTILAQEASLLQQRIESQAPSVWDQHRHEALGRSPSFASLPQATREILSRVSRIMLENAHTQASYTVGLLRDVLLSCVYEGGDSAAVLGEEVADKLLHQVRGDAKVLDSIVEVTKELPNHSEIAALARKMGAFSGERRVRSLI